MTEESSASDFLFEVKKLSEKAVLPSREYPLSSGYDLYSAAETIVPAGGKALVPTDISISVSEDTYGRIASRFDLASKHSVAVGAGVIDADYRGPVGVVLFNHSDVDFEIKCGDRITLLILQQIMTPEVVEVDELEEEPATKINHNGSHQHHVPLFKVKKLSENAVLPSRASRLSAGYDLYSAEDTKVPARGKALVPTDLSIGIPEETYGRIAPRSGLTWKHSIDIGAGVIDAGVIDAGVIYADYRGPVVVMLFNYSDVDFEIKCGDRIAQIILEKIRTPELMAEELSSMEPATKLQKVDHNGSHQHDVPLFKVKNLAENAVLPSRASPLFASYDLSSAEDTNVPARGKAVVPTDLSIDIPKDTYGRIDSIFDLAWKHSIVVGAGVIDADYRGPVGVLLFNHSDVDFEIKCGDRIAQLILQMIGTPVAVEVDELDSTDRGADGFGSTGV